MLKNLVFKAIRGMHIVKADNPMKDFGITAVCFHRISDETDYTYPSMPIFTFKGLIKHFSKNYSIILPKDIGKPTPKPKLIITFDDGYKDFMVNALPVLVQYKIPAIMHVVVNTVLTGELFWTQKVSAIVNQKLKSAEQLEIKADDLDYTFMLTKANAEKVTLEICGILMKKNAKKRNEIINDLMKSNKQTTSTEMMNVEDLKICLKNNISIGSHSYTHERLSLNLSKEELHREIFESKIVLDKLLNINVENFALPNGESNETLSDILTEAGYKNIFSTEDCIYTPTPNAKINSIPRILLFGWRVAENILRTNLFHTRIKNLLHGR